MKLNFGKVASDYAKYRDQLPEVMFQQLLQKGIDFKDQQVIDLGSGTGIFCRDLCGHGAHVVGIEPSTELIEEARSIDISQGLHDITYIQAIAEDFSFNKKFPIITVVRAWHWFDRDRVLLNIQKQLEVNGKLIIINSIFKPYSYVAQLTFEVLTNNNIVLKPAGSQSETNERRNGFPAIWFEEWEKYSFLVEEEWQHDYELQFTHQEWCGKIRSISWLANIEEEKRSKISNELLKKLSHYEAILNVPHQYSIVILNKGA